MSRLFRHAALIALWILPSASPAFAREVSTNLSFAGGVIVCAVTSPKGDIPGIVLEALPIAMNAALELAGPPPAAARLDIRLLQPPPFYKRAKALFRAEAFAVQEDDEIRLHPGDDPLKLSFRIGHELAHWLVAKRHPERPPLWLDEGLAQLAGAAAAETMARTRTQTADRPLPPELENHLYALAELTALETYPSNADSSGAFYWQAEALVGALRRRLGPADFATYLGLLSVSGAPFWELPLRERWYFNNADFERLAEKIRPSP